MSVAMAEEVKYKPPASIGAPNRRVGGGTRGLPGKDDDERLKNIHLAVLAPASTGHTSKTQPTLYWAISDVIDNPVEIVLSEAYPESFEIDPLLDTRLKVERAGIHAVSLKEHEVVLKPGVEYEFFVTIIRDPKQRSMDIIASGMLMSIEPETGLQQQLANAKQDELIQTYAANGLWYDLIEHLSSQLQTVSDDKMLREIRAAFLKQVNLPQIAALE
ncbi:MAG: DUF928 domain-containing protein [Pseudomonadota bacterium]